jgi:hypothetical protein
MANDLSADSGVLAASHVVASTDHVAIEIEPPATNGGNAQYNR